MMIDLLDKHVIVTGASSGLGRSISILASKLGARISLYGRHKQRLDETLGMLEGKTHQPYTIDLTNFNALEEIVEKCVYEQGPVAGYVHSAGIERTLSFRATTPEVFKELMDINLIAGFELARLISQKKSIRTDGASFVFISSVMGQFGEIGKVAYCASKSALLSASKAIALELAAKRIRCNCILPGIVETEMVQKFFDMITEEAKNNIIDKHPLGIGKPEDVASLTCFLLSDKARWITGSDYVIDGGYSAH